MPISREPQVSDLGFCDRETGNLGLAQHSPRRDHGTVRSGNLFRYSKNPLQPAGYGFQDHCNCNDLGLTHGPPWRRCAALSPSSPFNVFGQVLISPQPHRKLGFEGDDGVEVGPCLAANDVADGLVGDPCDVLCLPVGHGAAGLIEPAGYPRGESRFV